MHLDLDAPPSRAGLALANIQGAEAKATAGRLHVFWCWGDRGKWQTPAHPRLAFAGAPVLYKLYVVHPVSGDTGSAATEDEQAFLKLLLPRLQECLFGGA